MDLKEHQQTTRPTSKEEASLQEAYGLLAEFHAAINARDFDRAKALKAKLESCGAAAGINMPALSDELTEAKDGLDKFIHGADAVQAVVTNVAAGFMSSPSFDFFSKFKPGASYDALMLDKNGSFGHSFTHGKLDGQELRDAFANLEAGRMNNDQLGVLQKSLGQLGPLPDEKRIDNLTDALNKMEEYQAAAIAKRLGSDEAAKPEIAKNHEAFQKARDSVKALLEMLQPKPKTVPQELHDSVLQSKHGELQDNLSAVHALLVPGDSAIYKVSDVTNDTKSASHGLPAGISGQTFLA